MSCTFRGFVEPSRQYMMIELEFCINVSGILLPEFLNGKGYRIVFAALIHKQHQIQ